MFADSLIETSSRDRTHRGWTTLASFALQAVTVSLLMLLPLFHPEGLPLLLAASPIAAPAPPPGPPPAAMHARVANQTQSNLSRGVLVAPPRIPSTVAMLEDTAAPPVDSVSSGPWVPGGTGPGGNGRVPWGMGDNNPATLPPPPPPPPPLRVSRMMEGNLVHRVQPVYPEIARRAHIQGAVLISAIIGKDGTIENLRVLSGHPMLVKAAIDAVSQWRYRPYYLNGEPVEVETQITVNFLLAQ